MKCKFHRSLGIGSQNHKVIEGFSLEGTFRDHLFQPPVPPCIFLQVRSLKASSNLVLNISRCGSSTTSLENLFQCFVMKNVFLMSDLNVSSFNFNQFVLSPQILVKSLFPPSSLALFIYKKATKRSSESLLFLRLN